MNDTDLLDLREPRPPRTVHLATVFCCREWVVVADVRIGHCGLCGQIPRVTENTRMWTEEWQ